MRIRERDEDGNLGEYVPVGEHVLSAEDRLAKAETEITSLQLALTDSYEQLLQSQDETTQTQIALTDVYETLISVQDELAALKGGSN
ncbi:hypothetical protein D3C71_1595570 [compost metagenome]